MFNTKENSNQTNSLIEMLPQKTRWNHNSVRSASNTYHLNMRPNILRHHVLPKTDAHKHACVRMGIDRLVLHADRRVNGMS